MDSCDCGDNCRCGCKGYCGKCHGLIWGVIGVLMLLNVFVWPRWTGIDGWMTFFGLLLVLGGIWKSLMPGCACGKDCKCESTDKPVVPAELPKAETMQPVVKEAKKRKK